MLNLHTRFNGSTFTFNRTSTGTEFPALAAALAVDQIANRVGGGPLLYAELYFPLTLRLDQLLNLPPGP